MKAVVAVLGVMVALVLVVTVAAVGSTSAPFEGSGIWAVGKVQNSLGDQYKLDAAQLTATWTFTRDAQVVLRFEAGDVTVNGQALPAGCYSGSASTGEVISLDGASHVSFVSPATDTSCGQLP